MSVTVATLAAYETSVVGADRVVDEAEGATGVGVEEVPSERDSRDRELLAVYSKGYRV